MGKIDIDLIVRRYFEAYEAKDQAALRNLLSEDFVFSSPRDNRISKEAYMGRCWPFSERVQAFHIEKLANAGNEAFVQYECEPKSGARFRNTEYFRVEDDKVKEVIVYFGRATEAAQPEPEIEAIRKLVDRRVEAVRARDVAGATELVSSDLVRFDVVNPLQTTGAEASRRRTAEWFSSFDGPIGFEIRDLQINANDGIAFSYGLNHVSATTKAGAIVDMWWRWTACYRKVEGTWKLTHEHNSVPFDTATGKASLDLKP
ncbi:MAG: nuclear transport factor 2 family protein [Acidobacteriaceae bacterium]